MSFIHGTEEYYQKFIELQEKLRKSEEERLKLEMKFNEMMQHTKEEEHAYYKKLRAKYKIFLEEDRRRQERNEKILRILERIESRAAIISKKTERFQMLRRQYQAYIRRITHKPIPDNTKITEEDHPGTRRAPFDQKPTPQTQDQTKADIIQKYFQSLDNQKSKESILGQLRPTATDDAFGYSPRTYKDDAPNYTSAIADDILNSLQTKSRSYEKKPREDIWDKWKSTSSQNEQNQQLSESLRSLRKSLDDLNAESEDVESNFDDSVINVPIKKPEDKSSSKDFERSFNKYSQEKPKVSFEDLKEKEKGYFDEKFSSMGKEGEDYKSNVSRGIEEREKYEDDILLKDTFKDKTETKDDEDIFKDLKPSESEDKKQILVENEKIDDASIHKQEQENAGQDPELIPKSTDQDLKSIHKDPQSTQKDPKSTEQDTISTFQDPNSTHQDPNSTQQDPKSVPQDPKLSNQDSKLTHQDSTVTYKEPNLAQQDPNYAHQDPNYTQQSPNYNQQNVGYNQQYYQNAQPRPRGPGQFKHWQRIHQNISKIVQNPYVYAYDPNRQYQQQQQGYQYDQSQGQYYDNQQYYDQNQAQYDKYGNVVQYDQNGQNTQQYGYDQYGQNGQYTADPQYTTPANVESKEEPQTNEDQAKGSPKTLGTSDEKSRTPSPQPRKLSKPEKEESDVSPSLEDKPIEGSSPKGVVSPDTSKKGESPPQEPPDQQTAEGYSEQYLQYDEQGNPIQYDAYGQPIYYQQEGQYEQYDPNQQYDEYGQPIYNYEGYGDPNQYQGVQYDESGQPVYDEQGQMLAQYPSGYEEQYPNQENSHKEELPTAKVDDNISKQDQSKQEDLSKQDDAIKGASPQGEKIPTPDAKEESKIKVMDMLDTDTESMKQDLTKDSNESDFDFSKS